MRQHLPFCDSQEAPVSPRCSNRLSVVAFLAVIVTAAICHAGPKARLVEVRDDVMTYTGKVVAKDTDFCYLMDPSGAVARLPVAQLESFKVVSETFRPSSVSEIRQQLQSEFRSGYEIRTTAHYVVVGRKSNALAYASLFEEIYRQVVSFYSRHGFETTAPEVPLIAIVFGTQEEFRTYCERDEVLWSKDLRGYYSLKTNRVALYDDPDLLRNTANAALDSERMDDGLIAAAYSSESNLLRRDLAKRLSAVTGATASTIVHEATHQVGYNIGVHSRIGETPVWVVEGLATVLEPPGVRTRGKSPGSDRINAERLEWYTVEYRSRRQPGDLAKLIASDDMFHNQTLDAYSAAWAFSYFLFENPARAKLFVRYLKVLSARDPLVSYRPEDRLKDFQKVFGDISRLELEYLRATDQL